MPKHPSRILDLAKRGAEHRLRELEAEIASLKKIFAHLQYGSAVSPSMPDAVEAGALGRRARRKSAVQRKAATERTRVRQVATRKQARAKTKR